MAFLDKLGAPPHQEERKKKPPSQDDHDDLDDLDDLMFGSAQPTKPASSSSKISGFSIKSKPFSGEAPAKTEAI